MNIIRRPAWTTSAAPGAHLRQPVPIVFVHCFAVPDVTALDTPAEVRAMQAVDRAHKANGWAGLGYNFVGFDSGRVYEGRGWSHVGAQVEGYNSVSLGYAWAIDGDRRPPTPKAWQSLSDFLVMGLRAGTIKRTFELRGHRTASTAHGKTCPGVQTTDAELRDLERWSKGVAGVL